MGGHLYRWTWARPLARAWLALPLAGAVWGGFAPAAQAEQAIRASGSATASEAADAASEGLGDVRVEEPTPAYGSSDLDRYRGESVPLDAHAATPSEPDFGAETKDPGELPGRSRPLDAFTRPPDGRDPGAPEDGDDRPAALRPAAAPLRLRRRPDVAAAAERSFSERLCSAERDVVFAAREQRDAVLAYKRARRDGYPRGPARALVIEHRELTTRRLDRAKVERAALQAEAETHDLDPTPPRCRASSTKGTLH